MPSNATTESVRIESTSRSDLVDDGALAGGVSADEFRLAFRNHAAGVAVITADAGDGPVGMTATSVISVSAAPPLLLFSVSSLSSATPTILRAKSLVVHLLDSTNVAIARLCATSGIDRFADTESWDRLPSGEPYFLDASVRIRGDVVNTYNAGMSTLVVVHVTQVALPSDSGDALNTPLVYHDRTWLALDRSVPLA